jgi:hypothetical protein
MEGRMITRLPTLCTGCRQQHGAGHLPDCRYAKYTITNREIRHDEKNS